MTATFPHLCFSLELLLIIDLSFAKTISVCKLSLETQYKKLIYIIAVSLYVLSKCVSLLDQINNQWIICMPCKKHDIKVCRFK